MDIDLPQESENEPPDSEYTIIQRLAGLLAGGLAIYSFFTPYVRADADISVTGFNLMSSIGSEQLAGSFSLTEYVGIVSYAYPIDGNLIVFLAAGGATLITAGALANKFLTALGGIMTLGGAGFLMFGLSTTTMEFFGGYVELSIALEPAFGIALLGVSGLVALFSLQL